MVHLKQILSRSSFLIMLTIHWNYSHIMVIVMVLVSYTVMSKSSTNQVDLCHLDLSLVGVSRSPLRRISGIACASVPSLTQTLSQTTQQKPLLVAWLLLGSG